MEKYIQSLRSYVAAHPPNFGDCDTHSILEMLFCHYSEFNRLDNENIKQGFEEVLKEGNIEASILANKNNDPFTHIPSKNDINNNSAPVAEKSKHVHVIGDAFKVGSLRTVIWQAWDVAMKI